MRRDDAGRVLALLGISFLPLAAQVISPLEIAEDPPHALQQRYMSTLQAVASDIACHKFPYHFYFSRVLDIDEQKQQQLDQRSIRFTTYKGKTVLEITGNYFASYSAQSMDANTRARRTFFDVMLPVLKSTVPLFPADQDFDAFALEISHHVRGEVLGLKTENAENVALILPRAAAKRIVNATTLDQQQTAILDASVYLDGEPILLWLADQPAPADWNKRMKTRANESNPTEVTSLAAAPIVRDPSVSVNLTRRPEMPVRLIAPDTLTALQSSHKDVVARMMRELQPQAHFVSYAPPAFIAFHQGAYLQLSLKTELEEGARTRYAAAALAFDDHISHLVRPLLAFFQQDSSFDGVDFSTTVKSPGSANPVAVEFLLPFSAMRCYAQYDCTGQQLVDSGIVLINGERSGLDLQRAEAEK